MADKISKDALNEGMALARQMKNTFRAFENAEKVLQLLAGSEQSVGEHLKQIRTLKGQIDGLAAQKADLVAGIATETARFQDFEAQEKARIEAEVAAAKAAALTEISVLAGKVKAAHAKEKQVAEHHAKFLAGIDAEQAAAQEALTKATKKLAELKKSLGV